MSKDVSWWVNNIFKEFMKECVVFCYIPELAGVVTPRMEMEKELWRQIGTGKFIVADRILDYLLNLEAYR